MPELKISSLPDFVRNAEIIFHDAMSSIPQTARQSGLFREISIPQLTGNTREFTEIDLEEYAKKKGESDQSERAKVQQGYTKIGTLYRVSKDIGISYEMRTQGKYPEIKARLVNLGRLAVNRLDLDLSHRIGFGASTTYTDMDGESVDIAVGDTKALFATDHTLRGSATTFRNILANNPLLSHGSLEAMEKMRLENTYNQFGEKMAINANILWTTDNPNTVNTAIEILRSTSNINQNNPSVVNTYQAKYNLVVLPRVATDANGAPDSAKATYWGLASSEMSTAYLGVHEEPHMKTPPAEGRNSEEFSTDDWDFGTRAGWMIAIVSASWISLSKGDASA